MYPSGLTRLRDIQLSGMGFDRAREYGLLGSYMEMMNRGASGGYAKRAIAAAKAQPGKDILLSKRGEK